MQDTTLGIFAGGTGVPCEIAEAVVRRGRKVHIVGVTGEAEPEIERYSHTWVNLGGIGSIIRAFRQNGCEEIVFVGRMRRPNLAQLRPDWGFWTSLPIVLGLLRGGDDAVLRTIVRFFERHGMRVVGAHEAAPELIAPAGILGRHRPEPAALEAISVCAGALRALGPFDAAQAAVARGGTLQCVEGADGTDAMLRRLTEPVAGQSRRVLAAGGGPGVLVKLPKPGQEKRMDLPAIGPETVRRAAEAGLSGIAVLSGETLFAERKQALALADAEGIFIMGLAAQPQELVARNTPASESDVDAQGRIDALKPLARTSPSPRHVEDAELGAKVLEALEPFWPQASAIVSRGYVLATEGPGQAMGAAERAGRLKPWGARLLRRKSGVIVMSDIAGELGFDPAAIIRRARASGLAGLVILHSPRDEAALAMLRTAADDAGLFLLAPGDAL